MHTDTNNEKSGFFVQSPSSIVASDSSEVVMPQLSQEDRELLKAGYDIYHISAHRQTYTLIINPANKEIIENEGDITLKSFPNNLEELNVILSKSELSDATVKQLLLN
jgi:hypothetical protein